MTKCPWLNGSMCSRRGMLACDIWRERTDICRGRQIEGVTYRDCKYYENPKDFAYGDSYKPCPCAIVTKTRKRYYASCNSPKNPACHEGPVGVMDDEQAAMCIGRAIHGKKYTSCRYYVRGGKKKATSTGQGSRKQSSKNQSASRKNNSYSSNKKTSARNENVSSENDVTMTKRTKILIWLILFALIWYFFFR